MLCAALQPLWFHYGAGYRAGCLPRTLARYGNLAEAYAAVRRSGAAAFPFLPEGVAARLCKAAADGFLETCVESFDRAGVRWAARGGAGYPALLGEICDPPNVLFYKGTLPPESMLPLAVVGSRACTAYGREMAETFARAFAAAGAVVVSGMANGVDAAAARGALSRAGGECPTVAVLGTGVDVPYPAANRRLYDEIVERGAVVSEFWPGTQSARENFPIRNRIMSGMARGVLVVEAAERSGTSITAGMAHDEGRDVFAIPGRIGDEKSRGTNGMIQRGEAMLVLRPEDVLDEYGWTAAQAEESDGARLAELSEGGRAIYAMLQKGERTIDELCEALPYSPGEINSCLTDMAFSGIMKQLPGRVYALDRAHAIAARDAVDGREL